MSVIIKPAPYLLPYTGGKDIIEVEGNTVRECLNNLVEQFPDVAKMIFDENKRLLDFLSVFSGGGEIAYADQLKVHVKDGDILNIIYIFGGG